MKNESHEILTDKTIGYGRMWIRRRRRSINYYVCSRGGRTARTSRRRRGEQ